MFKSSLVIFPLVASSFLRNNPGYPSTLKAVYPLTAVNDAQVRGNAAGQQVVQGSRTGQSVSGLSDELHLLLIIPGLFADACTKTLNGVKKR